MKRKPENKNLFLRLKTAVCESHAIVALTHKKEVALSQLCFQLPITAKAG